MDSTEMTIMKIHQSMDWLKIKKKISIWTLKQIVQKQLRTEV